MSFGADHLPLGHLGGAPSFGDEDDDAATTHTHDTGGVPNNYRMLVAFIILLVVLLIAYDAYGRSGSASNGTALPVEGFHGGVDGESNNAEFSHPEWDDAGGLFTSTVEPDAILNDDFGQQSANPADLTGGELGESDYPQDAGVKLANAGVYAALSRLYSTADVDPLITGQAFAYRDDTRDIYDQRSSHGGVWGLQEFSSSGNPGDVGVDVGPDGLAEYEGSEHGYDDGIPEEWRLPSTPIRWYKPRQRDYYGPEGVRPYTAGLFAPFTPDHDPLIGEDESPDY